MATGKYEVLSKFENCFRDAALIRSGINRTGNQETFEALFMTFGYVYETADQAAATGRCETNNFVYSCHENPTLRASEERLVNLEGAEACKGY